MVDYPRNHPLKWGNVIHLFRGTSAKAKNSLVSHDKGEHEDVEGGGWRKQDDEADEEDQLVFIIVIIIILIIIIKINP